ncbi:Mu transposase C-terminal domain-containing protein [Streptomyces sp. NPDC058527]
MARAGYIEAPRDPDLAYEFLKTEWRTIQHYGVEIGRRRYSGPGLKGLSDVRSPYKGPVENGWPFQVDPDDITRIYVRDLDRRWRTLRRASAIASSSTHPAAPGPPKAADLGSTPAGLLLDDPGLPQLRPVSKHIPCSPTISCDASTSTRGRRSERSPPRPVSPKDSSARC